MTILSEPRRNFLKKSSIGTSVLFIGLNSNGLLAATSSISKDVIFNPFVKIDKNGIVTVVSKHFEMGQGTTTGLTTLVAEELDANWLTTKVEFAPADATKYKNLLFGVQGTGGSTAMPNSFFQYREAGAAAREVLVKAAANKWGVSESSVKVSDGYLSANGNLDSCIALRTAVIKDSFIYIQAGAGIVADSHPKNEFLETENKALALLEATLHAKNFKY